jgi:hypothetical protein
MELASFSLDTAGIPNPNLTGIYYPYPTSVPVGFFPISVHTSYFIIRLLIIRYRRFIERKYQQININFREKILRSSTWISV